MSEMKRKQTAPSWNVSDAFWQKVESLIPAPQRDPNREYARKPGAGRKPLPPRQVFAGIVYVLRTGIQWKALPKERLGSPSAIHRHFLRWQAAGFFEQLWQAGLIEYDEMAGIAWTWQSLDGSLSKAPLARDAVGPNPTDRGKKREQAQPLGGRAWRPVVARRERRGDAGRLAAVGDAGRANRSESQGLFVHAAISER
jgi:transposase